MKVLSVVVFTVWFLLSCASTPQCPSCPVSPPEDIIIVTPYGPVRILQGTIVPDNYYTVQEWDEFVKSYYDSLNPANNM